MTITTYDPMQAQDAAAWLDTPPEERVRLVTEYHAAAGMSGTGLRVHCGLHVTVENQIAQRDPPETAEKLRQLMAQGLDRHQAVHAIASVVLAHMRKMIGRTADRPGREALAATYVSGLKRMNARKWLKSG